MDKRTAGENKSPDHQDGIREIPGDQPEEQKTVEEDGLDDEPEEQDEQPEFGSGRASS